MHLKVCYINTIMQGLCIFIFLFQVTSVVLVVSGGLMNVHRAHVRHVSVPHISKQLRERPDPSAKFNPRHSPEIPR